MRLLTMIGLSIFLISCDGKSGGGKGGAEPNFSGNWEFDYTEHSQTKDCYLFNDCIKENGRFHILFVGSDGSITVISTDEYDANEIKDTRIGSVEPSGTINVEQTGLGLPAFGASFYRVDENTLRLTIKEEGADERKITLRRVSDETMTKAKAKYLAVKSKSSALLSKLLNTRWEFVESIDEFSSNGNTSVTKKTASETPEVETIKTSDNKELILYFAKRLNFVDGKNVVINDRITNAIYDTRDGLKLWLVVSESPTHSNQTSITPSGQVEFEGEYMRLINIYSGNSYEDKRTYVYKRVR